MVFGEFIISRLNCQGGVTTYESGWLVRFPLTLLVNPPGESIAISISLITDPLKIFRKDLDLGRRKKETVVEIDLIGFLSATWCSSLIEFYEIPAEIDLPGIQIDNTNHHTEPHTEDSSLPTQRKTSTIFTPTRLEILVVIYLCYQIYSKVNNKMKFNYA